MKKVKRLWAAGLALALLFSLTACGDNGSGDSDAGEGEELIFTVGFPATYDTLNFFSTESSKTYDFFNFCYDSLIAYDAEYNAIPRAAERWECSEDGLVWTFYLRDDIYFNDGEQLTSADVKWTYEHASESYMYSSHAGGIASIECPDDFTVVFNCETPKNDMLYQIIPILPEHIWANVDDIFTYESDTLVGSGPFIYSAERSTNGNIAFVRNDNYWGTKPTIDVLVFTVRDSSDALAQALQLGEIDAAVDLDKNAYDVLKNNSNITVDDYEQPGFEYLGYNMLDSLASDKVIRYAIEYCFDRENAIEMGYSGLADIGYGPVNNEGFVWTPEEDIFRGFDIDAANQLLDEAGYLDSDGDGIREKDGQPISLELISSADRWSWQSAVVNMMIANCAQAGIEITSTALESVTMWDTCCDGSPDWQLTLDGWGGDADPGFILGLFLDWENGGYAGVSYANPEYDEMYYKMRSTIDRDEYADYIAQCQRILYEDCPYTFICYATSVQAIDSGEWTGFSINSSGMFQNELIDTYLNLKPVG